MNDAKGRIYIVKMRTARELPDLIKSLMKLGEVVAFNEARGTSEVNAQPLPPTHRRTGTPRTEEQRLSMIEKRLAAALKRKAEVYEVLGPILQQNQYAPLERIIDALNKTHVRPERGGPWRRENIQPYMAYAMEQLTRPVGSVATHEPPKQEATDGK